MLRRAKISVKFVLVAPGDAFDTNPCGHLQQPPIVGMDRRHERDEVRFLRTLHALHEALDGRTSAEVHEHLTWGGVALSRTKRKIAAFARRRPLDGLTGT